MVSIGATSISYEEIILRLSKEPYELGLIPPHWETAKKRAVKGKFIAISGLRLTHRNTSIIHPMTRVAKKGDILELTLTDGMNAAPGKSVNNILYLGFFEVESSGVIAVGDNVTIMNENIGNVAGFSDVHCPNHLNVIIKCEELDIVSTGKMLMENVVELNINLEDDVVIGSKQISRV